MRRDRLGVTALLGHRDGELYVGVACPITLSDTGRIGQAGHHGIGRRTKRDCHRAGGYGRIATVRISGIPVALKGVRGRARRRRMCV